MFKKANLRRGVLLGLTIFVVLIFVYLLEYVILGNWGRLWIASDSSHVLGIPIPFYVVNCGWSIELTSCQTGLLLKELLEDIFFWLIAGIAVIWLVDFVKTKTKK